MQGEWIIFLIVSIYSLSQIRWSGVQLPAYYIDSSFIIHTYAVLITLRNNFFFLNKLWPSPPTTNLSIWFKIDIKNKHKK
jgi:hypothetical protein